MSDKLEVPRLKVKRDWHVGLDSDPVDRSHPDVHDDELIQGAVLNSKPCKKFSNLYEACSIIYTLLSTFSCP